MSASTVPERRHQESTEEVLLALESHGLLDPGRHEEAAQVVDVVQGGASARSAGLRRVLAEVAAYVGVAFVVAAVAVFVAPRWLDLSLGVRLGLLGTAAVVLGAAGLAVATAGGGPASLRSGARPERRRLASALLTSAAVASAAAVGVYVADRVGADFEQESFIWMSFSLTLLVLAAAGYAVAPSLLAQAAMVAALVQGVPLTWDSLATLSALRTGLTYLLVGVLWLLLAERGVLRELLTARLVASAFLVGGAQALMGGHAWAAYTVTLLVGVAGFALYVSRRAWPFLVLGVVGVTLAVPEALLDWTEGSLGTAIALLAAGITLLLASLVGLRLRQEATATRESGEAPPR